MMKVKKHGIIFSKIQIIEVEVMKEVLYDEIKDEVLEIFLCDGIANIKIEENTSKN